MVFSSLEENHIPEIKSLSNNVFGKNFLGAKNLKEYLTAQNKHSIVVLESNVVIGFIFSEILTNDDFISNVLSNEMWFKEYFSPFDTICLIKQIVVHPSHQNKGIASQLLINMLNHTESLVDTTCCFAWMKGAHTPLANILFNNSFKKNIVIDNYWYRESIEKNYDCSVCGSPPCSCSVAVYAK